jgi:hypothetical protein
MRLVAVLLLQWLLAVSLWSQSAITLTELQGTWRGTFNYPSAGRRPSSDSRRQPVEFIMIIRLEGTTCRGRTEEPNTFGDRSTPKLYANTDCQVVLVGPQARLVFKKTYDGTGAQWHSVDYDGEISADGRRVLGTWRIGTQSGRFSLVKQ